MVGADHQGPKTKVADSKKEFRRLGVLVGLVQSGRIHSLRQKRTFWLHVNGVRMCRYIADFVYIVGGRLVVEDVKSDMTRSLPMYKLKKKWLRIEYGLRILET